MTITRTDSLIQTTNHLNPIDMIWARLAQHPYPTIVSPIDARAGSAGPLFGRSAHIREEHAMLTLCPRMPKIVTGYCSACDAITDITLSAKHGNIGRDGSVNIAFSETGTCKGCGLNSRMRFVFDILRAIHLSADALIYATEQTTQFFKAVVQAFPKTIGSEWLGPDKQAGHVYEGLRHEDLHSLTFADHSFSVTLCLDVLEHVNQPDCAIAELFRVTMPGGLIIVSFPFFPQRTSSVRRAEIRNGEIHHLKPERYHGNPLGGGALVFWELSWDFIRRLANNHRHAAFVNYWSLHRHHLGGQRYCLILVKQTV